MSEPNPATPPPGPPRCVVDGVEHDTYDNEHEWQCAEGAAVLVDGEPMCLTHAGERGHGPLQSEYGYDQADGRNPTPELPSKIWINGLYDSIVMSPVIGGGEGFYTKLQTDKPVSPDYLRQTYHRTFLEAGKHIIWLQDTLVPGDWELLSDNLSDILNRKRT